MLTSFFSPIRRFLIPVSLALLSIAFALGDVGVRDLLRYERVGIGAGEGWRLITAHLVHLGWSHLWLNLAGLALIWLLVGHAFRNRNWIVVFLACALGTSAALYVFNPQLGWYLGLSGVLHGLLVAGAVASWRLYREGRWILGLVTAKLLWEQVAGPVPGSADTAGGPIIVDAHFYGALSGLLAALFALGFRRLSAKASV